MLEGLRPYRDQVSRLARERETSRRAFWGGVLRHRVIGNRPIWIGSPTVLDDAARVEFGRPGSELRIGLGDYGLTSEYDVSVVRIRPGGRLLVDGTVSLQRGVRIVVDAGTLSIGHGTNVNGLSKILVGESVTIGAGCTLSWDVQLLDHDFHTITVDGQAGPESAPVAIGDRVWVGTGALILKGVTVGEGAVVGAGAVVTRDVPAYSVAAGSPARVVGKVDSWT